MSTKYLEPVQELDQWMECKANVGETAQHTVEYVSILSPRLTPQYAIQ